MARRRLSCPGIIDVPNEPVGKVLLTRENDVFGGLSCPFAIMRSLIVAHSMRSPFSAFRLRICLDTFPQPQRRREGRVSQRPSRRRG